MTSFSELLALAAPETALTITALAVLGVDLLGLRELDHRFRRAIGAMICCSGCLLAIGWMLVFPQQANVANGFFVLTPVIQFMKIGVLVLTILTLLLSIETDFTVHIGEYFALVLLATLGMLFLISSEDVLMIFIALELTSLSLYILTAFNKRNVKSAEAAMKYFLFGGMAAAFTLFGLSLLYGISGTTNLAGIARGVAEKAVQITTGPDGATIRIIDPLAVAGMIMTVIGFGFKIAAVPFHLWAPDAYEGAPIPSAALIASGSKVASFFVFAKVMTVGFAGVEGSGAWREFASGWVPVLAVLAALSMVLGNLAAIVQTSVRRLLAYSAIAHAGYMLLGILTHNVQGLASLTYYLLTYGLTAVGAFGVVSVVQEHSGSDKLSDFAGLSRRAPVLSFCMMVFMLSLAGIPPLAGFFGKFYLFIAAAGNGSQNLGLLWLVILAVAMSAVSLYYYLQVLKQIYVAPPSGSSAGPPPILSQVVLSVIALTVLVLGCMPELLLHKLMSVIQFAGK
jgi:NADH-quinone oxidoreductase subunit N